MDRRGQVLWSQIMESTEPGIKILSSQVRNKKTVERFGYVNDMRKVMLKEF